MSVESELGKGSSFTMQVPALCGKEPDGAAAEVATVQDSPARPVLVIDDEPAARKVIADALAEAGLPSIQAGSGAEGIELARRHRPAPIVLDIIMPHQDGWSVLRALKGDEELSGIPVILATILADRDSVCRWARSTTYRNRSTPRGSFGPSRPVAAPTVTFSSSTTTSRRASSCAAS